MATEQCERRSKDRKTPTNIIRPIHPTVNSEPTKKKTISPHQTRHCGHSFFLLQFSLYSWQDEGAFLFLFFVFLLWANLFHQTFEGFAAAGCFFTLPYVFTSLRLMNAHIRIRSVCVFVSLEVYRTRKRNRLLPYAGHILPRGSSLCAGPASPLARSTQWLG